MPTSRRGLGGDASTTRSTAKRLSAFAIWTLLAATVIPGLAQTPELDRSFNSGAGRGRRISRARLKSRIFISLFLMVVLAISMMTVLSQWPQGSDDAPLESPVPARLQYTGHNKIDIIGNEGFLESNESTGISWGSGTESDPYIIEGWDIDADDFYRADGIAVYDTNAHFIIRACRVVCVEWYVMYYVPSGILLSNCTNAVLDSNFCWKFLLGGIYLEKSSNITISNNRCELLKGMNPSYGICLSQSDNITISNNTCSIYNPGHTGWYDGIRLQSSSDCTIEDNNCSTQRYGIGIFGSHSNVVTRNVLYENDQHGVRVESSDNRIWNNTFYHNNGAGDAYDPLHIQAYDGGTSNWWNSSDGYGNNWSDWRGPDLYPMDGIVDYPYPIDGLSGSQDNYPIAEYYGTTIPEFSITPLVVMVFLAATVMTIGARRRKAS